MKTRILSFAVAVVAVASLSGCAGYGGYFQPAGLHPVGAIFSETTSGSLILDNGATPTKEGKACGTWVLVVGTGDTSVEKAMMNGGIKKVVFVTQYIKSILGPIYGEVCTIARGN